MRLKESLKFIIFACLAHRHQGERKILHISTHMGNFPMELYHFARAETGRLAYLPPKI